MLASMSAASTEDGGTGAAAAAAAASPEGTGVAATDAAGEGAAATAASGNKAAEAEAFRAMLPEDLRSHPTLKDLHSVEGMAKTLIHAQQFVGMDKLPIPGKDSPPEAWGAVWDRLGRPKTPDEYELVAPPDEFKEVYQPGFFEMMRGPAHKAGLIGQQFKDMQAEAIKVAAAALKADAEEFAKTADKDLTALRTEWGAKVKENDALALAGQKALGLDNERSAALERAIGTRPMMDLFLKVGARTSEGGLESGATAGGQFLTASQAQAEITRLKADKEFSASLTDPTAPGHKENKKRWGDLHQMAYPDEKA